MLQLAALSTLGSSSTSVRAENSVYWPSGLMSLEPIAHSIFGNYPLVLSNNLQIAQAQQNQTQTAKRVDSYRRFDSEGVEFHIAESGFYVRIVVRNIYTTRLALVLERYDDLLNPNTIAVYRFGKLFGHEIQTSINLNAFSNKWSRMNRIWALAEGDSHIKCAYVNIQQLWSSDG